MRSRSRTLKRRRTNEYLYVGYTRNTTASLSLSRSRARTSAVLFHSSLFFFFHRFVLFWIFLVLSPLTYCANTFYELNRPNEEKKNNKKRRRRRRRAVNITNNTNNNNINHNGVERVCIGFVVCINVMRAYYRFIQWNFGLKINDNFNRCCCCWAMHNNASK